ncbi:MAG: tetratricopeptide repeat protein [Labilithrix sp.]|nr:tetratricopeptide repeat protein [Labilithrix sp.]
MSDDRNDPLAGLGDLDWDSALDEWEKNTFVPEVARDADTNRVAGPLGNDDDAEGREREAEAGAARVAPPRPAAGARAAELPVPAPLTSDPALRGAPEGTLIAPVPRELRDDPVIGSSPPPRASAPPPRGSVPPARPSAPPSMRGGLDQLFSRPSQRPERPAPRAETAPSRPKLPIPRRPSETTRVAPPASPWKDPASVTRQASAPAFEDRESEATLVKASPFEMAEQVAKAPVVPPPFPPIPAREEAALPSTDGADDGGPAFHDFPPDDETAERPGPTASARDADGPTVSTRDLDAKLRESDVDDDENATVVRDRGSLSDADTATRFPADDEMPTMGRPSNAPAAIAPRSSPPAAARAPVAESPITFEGERPVSRWLDEEKTRAFADRIAWLEEEARATVDATARARALLALSELSALVGDDARAYDLATEARDLAPHLPLAWRQARQLMPRDPDALADALDAEAARSPTSSARAHAVLLAADLLRIGDRGDAAVERWDSACKLDPADTRAPIARAALALAQDDHTSGVLRLADNSELIAFDKAIATALRLRGVERPGAEVDDMPINDGLRHARQALGAGDIVSAAQSAGEIATLPELSGGALWLSAALGSAHIASRRASARALKTLAADGDALARRQLAARGIELGDPELVSAALSDPTAFEPAERALLGVLATSKGGDAEVDASASARLTDDDAFAPLVDALSAISPRATSSDAGDAARPARVAGNAAARALATLGRVLAGGAKSEDIDEALAAIAAPRPAAAGGVAIEAAVRGKRWGELSEALSSLPASDDAAGAAQRHVAAAIVAERAGNRDRAKEAWKEAAKDTSFATDGILRIAADLDREIDLGAELLRVADEMPDGVASAILRLEAIARSTLDDDAQGAVLERVHRAAPELGIGGFLAERAGRRKGDLDEVLRWIQERRAYATDPLETALDAVREALLVADRDPELASTRLEEAHRARPADVALRELHERLAPEPPADRGAWRDKRAEAAEGPAAALLWIEAALEHDRAGDAAAALAAARKATEAGDDGLARALVERAELATGDVTRQTDELIQLTKTTEDGDVRREALERLAHLDAVGKGDAATALLWHRSILEDAPRHKPSLRWLEHALVGEGRDDELGPIFEQIALALDGTAGGEATAHAQHAARLHARDAQAGGDEAPSAWERTHDMARLAATQPESSLWALRALSAHARARKDDEALLAVTLALLERTQRPPERASLLLRASEAAARLERVEEARAHLEQAASEDPGDVVTWGFLAELRERTGETRQAAEACESLARTSVVREHQLLAWHDAAKIWLDEVKDTERAMSALEAAAEIDATYADVFPRLSALYADKNLDAELARLLEKRLDIVEDDEERVALEVELSRAFAEMGELPKAKVCLESALEKRPDHTTALAAMAELCTKEGDWGGAEQAYVRLARLLSDAAEQRAIYERLGEIYSVHAPNLARAEIALKEVLKRSPGDLGVLTKLVDVFKRQGDVQKAVETQQEIIAAEADPNARLACLVELAKIHETVGRDPRRSEQVLDSARKEFPTSVVALRAMAEFYSRQRQMPAMQILLDRAAGDARRSFAQGRFVPSLFQVLHAAFELRGKRDAARVVAATLAAVEGQPSDLMGGEARSVDPRLDDVLAPDAMNPALRALLFHSGDALDAVAPVDLRILKATPLQPGTPIGATVGSVATVVGLGALQILVSPVLDRVALPLATNPPTLLVGEGLAKVTNERARMFVVVRAMKMILAHASALLRGQPQEVSGLVAGLFNAFNPSHVPQGMDPKRVTDLARRIGPALPRNLDPTVGVIALEAAGMLGAQWSSLGAAAHAWANRVALLAVGDPNAALDAIAWGQNEDAAPTGSEERAAWIARHAEARELMTFSVTDAYAEARVRLGLDR